MKQTKIDPVLADLLVELLGPIGDGSELAPAAVPTRLNAQQAAAVLNVPTSYLVSLLKNGAIDSERDGARRFVALADLLRFKRARDKKRTAVLDKLAQLDASLL